MAAQNISALTKYIIGAAANHSITARPSYQTAVYVSFILCKTLSLSNSGVLDLVTAINLTWQDPRLSWSPEEFGGLQLTPITSTLIWSPALALLNAASREYIVAADSALTANVMFNGWVMFMFELGITSSCTMNLDRFPFDSQTCVATFVSNGLADSKNSSIYFLTEESAPPVSRSVYADSGEFALLEASLSTSGAQSKVCSGLTCIPSADLLLRYKRRSSYYMLNLIVPAALLILVMPFTFLIPSDNSVKATMTCSLLVSMYVLQQNISRMLPPTASSSMCALGSIASLIFCCIAAVVAIVSVSVRSRLSRTSVPKMLHKFCGCTCDCKAKVTPDSPQHQQHVRVVRVSEQSDYKLSTHDASPTSKQPNDVRHDESSPWLQKIAALLEEQVQAQRADAERAKMAAERTRGWTTLDTSMNVVMFVSFVAASLAVMLVLEFQLV